MGERLRDRIAIVTGAGCVGPGWGNGRAVAVRFAEEGAYLRSTEIWKASPRPCSGSRQLAAKSSCTSVM